MAERIDYDERGELDDVAISDVEMFRLERMDDGIFWLCCYRTGKPDIVFWLHARRGRIKGEHYFE